MVDYSFPEGLLTPLAVNHFQVTGYTLSPTAWAFMLSPLRALFHLHRRVAEQDPCASNILIAD
jgi:hypothetical protein